MTQWLCNFFSTMFYLGFTPKAPGTMTSAIATVTLYFIHGYVFISDNQMKILVLTTIGLLTLIGFITIKHTEKEFGKDASVIVIDEWIGQWIALPFTATHFIWYVLGFVLFRILDIRKPFGITKLQKYPHAYGVIIDDVAAGLLAGLLLYGIQSTTSFFVWLF